MLTSAKAITAQPVREEDIVVTSMDLASICARVAVVAFLGILVLVPLVFYLPADDIFSLPKVTALRLLTVLALSAAGLNVALTGRLRVLGTALDLPVLGYLSALTVASLFSVAPNQSIYGSHFRHDGLITILNYVVVFYLATNILRSPALIRRALEVLIASAALIATWGLAQFFGLTILELRAEYFSFRAFSTLGNPDFLGTYLVLTLPLGLGMALSSERASRRAIWSVMTALIAAGLLASFTRGAWLGGFAAVTLFVVLARRQLLQRKFWTALALVVLALVIALIAFFPQSGLRAANGGASAATAPSMAQVASSFTDTRRGTTAKVRLLLWEGTLELIRESPILGGGLNSFMSTFGRHVPLDYARTEGSQQYPDKPHNEFLDTAASAGLIGLGAYLWLQVAVGVVIWRGLRNGAAAAGSRILLGSLAAALAGFTVQGIFLFSVVDTATIYWALLGVVVALCGATKSNFTFSFKLSQPVTATIILVVLSLGGLFGFLSLRPLIADVFFRQAQTAYQAVHGSAGAGSASERIDTSLALQRQALDWNSHDEELYRRYGFMLRGRAAVDPDPTQRRIYLDEAVRAISQAIAMNPQFAGHYYDRGQTFDMYGEDHLLDASADYRRSIFLYPYSYAHNMAYAAALHRLNRLQEAIVAERIALEVFPHDSKAMFDLGLDYFQLGRVDESISLWERLVKFEPENASLHTWLSRAYTSKGDSERAAEEAGKAEALKQAAGKTQQGNAAGSGREEHGSGK